MTRDFITWNRYQIMFIMMVPVFLFSCRGKGASSSYVNLKGEAFGTTYSINISSDSSYNFDLIHQQVDSLLDLINLSASTYMDSTLLVFFNDGKDLSRLKSKFKSDSRFLYGNTFLVKCQIISNSTYETTDGALDPTAGKLFNIWGFAEGELTRIPDSIQVQEALQTRGVNEISYTIEEDRSAFLTIKNTENQPQLNFNAIAKGVAVDEVAFLLESIGIENYTVEIGGEMRINGRKLNGSDWIIGINKPSRNAGLNEAILFLTPGETGMATSGNYRNYYEKEGVLYAHIIDPRTGYPAETDLLSVTVFHRECGIADAFATAFMVLGSEKSAEIAKEVGLEYIFVLADQEDPEGFKVIKSEKAANWIKSNPKEKN